MNRSFVSTLLVALFMFAAMASRGQSAPRAQAPLYLDPAQPIEIRVNDLVARMTLEEKISQLVNQSREVPRLQIPAYDWWSEALHGVAGPGFATVFPEPIGLAATFDVPLIHQMAEEIGRAHV